MAQPLPSIPLLCEHHSWWQRKRLQRLLPQEPSHLAFRGRGRVSLQGAGASYATGQSCDG